MTHLELKQHFPHIFDNLPISCIIIDFQGIILFTNEKTNEEFGSQLHTCLGKSLFDFIEERDKARVEQELVLLTSRSVKELALKYRIKFDNNRPIWIKSRTNIIELNGQHYIQLISINITDHKNTELLLKGKRVVLEKIAKDYPLKSILDSMIEIIENISEGIACAVHLISNDEKTLIHVAAPSLPNEYNLAMNGIPIKDCTGSCGTAAFLKQEVIVEDTYTHPYWAEYRELAMKFNLKACWSTPIYSSKQSLLGTFGMYYKESRLPDPKDKELVKICTYLIRVAIEHSKVKEEIIKQSEAKYKLIAENTTDLITVVNTQGIIKYASPSHRSVLGLNPEEMLGENVIQFLPSNYCKKVLSSIEKVAKNKVTKKGLFSFLSADGKEIWLDSHSAPMHTDSKNIEHILVISRDITEKQRNEVKIKKLFKEKELILNAAGEGIYGVNLDGEVTFCNQFALTLLGYSLEEVIGKNMHELIHYQTEDGIPISIEKCPISNTLSKGIPVGTSEDYFWKKDGTGFPVEYNANPIIDDHKIVGTVVTFEDITERKKQEQARRDEKIRIQTQHAVLVDLHLQVANETIANTIKLITEKASKTLHVNRVSVWSYIDSKTIKCINLFDFHTNSHSDGELIDLEQYPVYSEALRTGRMVVVGGAEEDLQKNTSISEYINRYNIKSLIDVPIRFGKEIVGIISFEHTGDCYREWTFDEQNFAGSIADLVNLVLEKEERRKTEDLLRKSEKLSIVGQLAAGVAHEIRNPLTSIKGFLQILHAEQKEKRDVDYFSIIFSELERINFISGELLYLAKPKLEKYEAVNIIHVINTTINLFHTEANLHNIQFILEKEVDELMITCDAQQIKQVFVNILKNAIEAMRDGGQVTVQIQKTHFKNVSIRFIDNGEGIPKDRLQKLGEPFYTNKEKGTGLGLMVSYRIIESHGGNIMISSELGLGTTVEVTLPFNKS